MCSSLLGIIAALKGKSDKKIRGPVNIGYIWGIFSEMLLFSLLKTVDQGAVWLVVHRF